MRAGEYEQPTYLVSLAIDGCLSIYLRCALYAVPCLSE